MSKSIIYSEAILKELTNKVCKKNEFQCRSGRCINGSSICDGVYDCLDEDNYSYDDQDEGEWCEYFDTSKTTSI